MNNVSLLLAVFTAVTSLVAAISSLIGTFQKRRIETLSHELDKTNQKLHSTRNELYKVYLNVNELLQIEEDLISELEVGKITVRRGYQTDRYIQPKRVKTRIAELEQEIQQS